MTASPAEINAEGLARSIGAAELAALEKAYAEAEGSPPGGSQDEDFHDAAFQAMPSLIAMARRTLEAEAECSAALLVSEASLELTRKHHAMWRDAEGRFYQAEQALAEAGARIAELESAINWACGCGDDFERPVGAPWGWWRSVLAERAGLEYDHGSSDYRAARLVASEPPTPDPVCKESLHTAGDAGMTEAAGG